MNHSHRTRRLAGALAGLTTALLALLAGAPAAFAYPVPPPGGTIQPAQVHTIVSGGMPGWQITLIAAGAAILAAALAVTLDRAHATRRQLTTPGN